jgi:hypothetical protein
MQSTIAALVIIVVGYFLSKILAAIVSSIVPAKQATKGIGAEETLPLNTRMARACFWISWLILIVIALNEVSPIPAQIRASLRNGDTPSLEGFMQLSLMALFAYVILLSEKYIARLFKAFTDFYRSIPLSRENPAVQFIIRFSWLPILIICGVALASPETLGYRVTVTILTLLFGWLFTTVLRQALSSLFNPIRLQHGLVAKFFSYFVFVHFIVAAVNLWI